MEISESDRELINKGAVQYFDALRALREFREVILGLCVDVVQRRGEDLAKAMKARIDIGAARDSIWPDRNEHLSKQALWSRAWIGRSLPFPDFGLAYWGIACAPGSARRDKAIAVYALVGWETNTAAIRDRALPRLKEACAAEIDNRAGNEVEIREKLNNGEIDRFPEALDRITDQWIKIWQYVGGLPGIGESAKQKASHG